MSSSSDDIRIILYLLILGPTFFYQGFQKLKLKRKCEGLAQSKARSMAMGSVELSGVAGSTVALIDPIYKRSCAYYNVKVQAYRSSGRSGHWETLFIDSSDRTGFICKDSTGEVLIVPKNPQLYLSTVITKEKSLLRGDLSDPAYVYLCQCAASESTVRLIANIIREGDPVYVVGCAVPASSSELTAQGEPGAAAVTDAEAAALLKKDPERLKRLDENGDGNIDAMEWQKGLEEFKKFLNAKRNQMRSENPAPSEPIKFSGMITCTPDVPLILANSEKYFLDKVGAFAAFAVIGGGGAIIAGLAMLISKYQ